MYIYIYNKKNVKFKKMLGAAGREKLNSASPLPPKNIFRFLPPPTLLNGTALTL